MIGLGATTALYYRGISPSTSTSSGQADQDQDTDTGGIVSWTSPGGVGQSFRIGDTPSEVTGVRLKLRRVGSPRGIMRVAVYADSGSDTPTGTALVFSPYYALDGVATTVGGTDYYFPLSGWTPDADTDYVLVLEQYDHFPVSASHEVSLRTAEAAYDYGSITTSSLAAPSEIAPASNFSVVSATDLSFTVYSDSGSGTVTEPVAATFDARSHARRRRIPWGWL